MRLRTLYRMAKDEDALAISCYRKNALDSMHVFIARRDALMDAILAHPKNKATRMQVMCEVISGLSAGETPRLTA